MSNKSEDFIFALQPDAIVVDDIVLTSDFGIIPFGIRQFTNSDLSHAALCTKPGMLFEAVHSGVLRRSVIGTFAHRRDWIKVLRPKTTLPKNKDGLLVADYAEALYGRAYSRQGAAASRFSILGGATDGAVFCSEVIAQAYLQYGVCLVPGKKPSQIYPGLLLTSPELIDVTDRCIRKLGSVTNADLYRQVIDTANHEMPGAEMRMNRRVFAAVQKELGDQLPKTVHSLTDLSIWLSQEFTAEAVRLVDGRILDVLEREGLFKWHDDFSADAQTIAATLEFAAKAAELSIGEPMNPDIQALLDDLIETIPLAEASLKAKEQTANDYDELAKTTDLKTFDRFKSLYRLQYDEAQRVHQARTRLIEALRRRNQ